MEGLGPFLLDASGGQIDRLSNAISFVKASLAWLPYNSRRKPFTALAV
ncbi:hypothetical protein Q4603_15065 [Zobellia galactanivorans]|nr:hypothetical protein [Zobellia galactanivorans]MBU3028417.1 hypothetical protein [Zobellia galactanivorans]MDO6809943.1 hypothetical protein [Zobellia galactanivorans]